MPFTLRPFRAADASLLADLYARSVRHFGPRGYTPAQVAAWAETADAGALAARLGDGRWTAVAVDANNAPLGFVDLAVQADDSRHGHIDLLYIAPEAAGTGLGTQLLAAVTAQARQVGLTQLSVHASELARPLFLRHGFRELRRNDLRLGEVAIHNYRLEKTL